MNKITNLDNKNKYVFFVNKGIIGDLGFLRYTYKVKNGYIYLKKFKHNYNKEYCYVSDYYLECLKDYMIKTIEVKKGVLRFVDDEKYSKNIRNIKK